MLRLAAVVLVLLLLSAASEAAETRYVASFGINNDDCSLSAPCRTLQRGVNRTPDGGKLVVLDSGDFGNSLTINRSITISAEGVTATLVDPGSIRIDDSDAVVVLRGLHLKGAGGPEVISGVFIAEAAAVHIERCTIERFASTGIRLFDNNATLFVTDSIVRNNGSAGLLAAGTAQAGRTLTVDNSRFENNGGDGVSVDRGRATITRSVASGNGGSGVSLGVDAVANVTWTTASHNGDYGFAPLAIGGQMTLESSVARNNSRGLYVAAGTARISRSVFTDNDIGIRVDSAGTLQRLQNNVLENNGTDLSNAGTVQATLPF
jgi:nitrous oxidase accessory protein NosD